MNTGGRHTGKDSTRHLLPGLCLFTALLFLFAPVLPAHALGPEEVLVIANRNAAKSPGLAKFYMAQRGIPKENLVLLWMTDKEDCTREAYEKKAVPPVRRFLKAHPEIRALVTVYGVPLKIKAPAGSGNHSKTNSGAAFDSELALVKAPAYHLKSWQLNPFYLGYKGKKTNIRKKHVMMVSRLDAPNAGIVRRMIKDSIRAEKEGLQGKAYFDARWPLPRKGTKLSGYAFYDVSLHKTARFHREKNILPVVLNQEKALFQPGQAPDAALYCGWYSLSNYVDAFQWNRGAVGYHMASGECATLKGNGNTWCKRILENGAAATIGPVSEPYIQAFPVPEIFFNLLTDGYLTLVEAYTVSLPFLSWQMILVGDPLYKLNIVKGEG
ncbi:MAG TPA: TIGR03790 family protein [Desulfobacteraceae bacterium]|nr:TIGR03790 family protein [Desulfobacteraceae bacterium]|tara:strand:- start:490 stop:1635 length:1146 start_codon:yes stop_codon:yes gene_type:complete